MQIKKWVKFYTSDLFKNQIFDRGDADKFKINNILASLDIISLKL